MAQELYELPEGWAWKALQELGKFAGGGTPLKSNADFWNGDILWITPKDMKKPELADSELKITPIAVRQSAARLLPSNSVLIVGRSGILKHTLPVCINKIEATINQDLKAFIPSERITPRFCQFMLKAFESFVLSELVKGGVTVQSLKFDEFKKHKFPVPPLEEQKRIVAQLDALFSRIDQTIAQLQHSQAQIKALWASALDAAFETARLNFQSKALKEVSISISTGPFGSMLHKADYVSEGFPLVNPINLQFGKIRPDSKKQVTLATADRLSRYKLKAGDIVTARRGEIGRCAVASEENVGWLCGTGCFFIRLSGQVRPAFVNYSFHSNKIRETLEKQATGATIKNISNKTLSSLKIPVPPLPEQEKIVAKLDAIAERTQALEATTADQLKQLQALKASLLDAAFRGQL